MNLTYCPLEIGITTEDIAEMRDAVLSAPASYWYPNEFRGCTMLPLMNRGGHLAGFDIHKDTQSGFAWTQAAEFCAPIVRVLEKNVFPWMEELSRVTILRIGPRQSLNIHIDCRDDEVGSAQHKFRIVLKGETSDLFFLGPDGSAIHTPKKTPVYVLDGGHPHGATNNKDEDRLILCVASPWKGKNKKYLELLEAHSNRAVCIARPPLKPEWCDLRRFGGT